MWQLFSVGLLPSFIEPKTAGNSPGLPSFIEAKIAGDSPGDPTLAISNAVTSARYRPWIQQLTKT